MTVVDQIKAETGHGITGDRYENSRRRHISVQSLEELAEAETELGRRIDPLQTRRNITVSTGRFTREARETLTIGTIELTVIRDAAPCRLMDEIYGSGAAKALRKRAGILCEVTNGGFANLGDQVTF